ncbi:alpha/beta hydrolase [Nocardioides mangrovicus]|uniref:Alpha/beta hydrolase n=1 Tax=Nocardioides mangrovicus TaxID=2478913 RepID=A0A3L8NZR5_9ACTN|nr:alpha/beta hydrolase [Nocardioides mangrovicus]RLV48676.1 alpha/beta hydrolase [Nocardioides mangrovicus]
MSALHPQAAAHLAGIAGLPTIAESTVAQARAAGLGYLQLQRPAPAVAHVEHRFIPGPHGDLPIRVIRPRLAGAPGPAVVVLHGSGWVIANLDVVDEPARVLAVDTGFTVVTVNYQKAPEHRFPVPLEDCVAAVRWVVEHADDLGVDPAAVAVVGDSAGGNLAAATTAELVADGVPIAAQALLYPALDHARTTASYTEFATGFGLDAADMAWFWRQYVDDEQGGDPRVSPLLADDVSALPPTFVATAGSDVLRDEGEAYAARLRGAGVEVQERRYDGMIHGFWWMDAVLDDARRLQRDLATFLCSRLHLSRSPDDEQS